MYSRYPFAVACQKQSMRTRLARMVNMVWRCKPSSTCGQLLLRMKYNERRSSINRSEAIICSIHPDNTRSFRKSHDGRWRVCLGETSSTLRRRVRQRDLGTSFQVPATERDRALIVWKRQATCQVAICQARGAPSLRCRSSRSVRLTFTCRQTSRS